MQGMRANTAHGPGFEDWLDYVHRPHRAGPERQVTPVDGKPVFLAGGGVMGELIRAHPWENTPLGEPDQWPQGLRTAVRVLLTTQHPVFIFWGAEHTCLYNDAYSRSIGPEKHPAILGAR